MQGPGEAVRSQSSAPRGPLGERAERGRPTLERAERSEAAGLGSTKEVLGCIIDCLAFNLEFLGFPILLFGFPRISIRILSGS